MLQTSSLLDMMVFGVELAGGSEKSCHFSVPKATI